MLVAALVLSLAQTTTTTAPPAPAPAAAVKPAAGGPIVALDVVQGRTTLGTITIALDQAKAPITVANFMKYVRAGHFDGTLFHRVIPGFMIQGGGFTPDMQEKPTRAPIRNEAKNGVRNSRGTIAMARTNDANSATAQFFINLRDNHSLDYGINGAGYAVFGRVIEGMAVVDKIATVPTTTKGPHQDVPQSPVVIKRAREASGPAAAATAPEPPK